MPSIITHDTFGHEVYHELFGMIGGSRDEAEAFLLGNQGPDPLFYSVALPWLHANHDLGSVMHDAKPAELIDAFKTGLPFLAAPERSVARAYALGFLCHYTLDSTAHPFIFAQQYALCDAGEPGLTRADGHEVHAYATPAPAAIWAHLNTWSDLRRSKRWQAMPMSFARPHPEPKPKKVESTRP